MMRLKAVIFDLDGTLLNTICDLCNAVNYALDKLKIEKITVEECLSFVGSGIKTLVVRSFKGKDADIDKALALFNEYYSKNCMLDSIPYLDIVDVLKTLKNENIKIGVASNKKHEYVEKLVKHYFGSLVDAYQGESTELRRKPDGDIVYKVLKELGVETSDIAYVGDSEVDVKTAQNINCQAVFVSYGFRSYDALEEAGAKLIAKNPKELIGMLEKL